MNPRIKRLLSLLLALTMVLSLTAPVSASAASSTAASGNTVEIEVGETVKLKVSGSFFKTTWTTSDADIATVSSNGTVAGVAPGTATITATSKSFFSFWGGTKTAKFTVIVTAPVEKLTVKAGETLQLDVETSGGKVTWKSSNKKVATVDGKGLVTGIREGDVTITATETKTTGGSKFPWFFWWGGGKTTTSVTEFEVTVIPGDEQPTDPEAPTDPEVPTEPEEPTDPEVPTEPEDPTEPEIPTEPDEPIRPTMPENPSEADEYFWSTSDVIEVIPAEESEAVLTEVDAIDLLKSRGFEGYPVIFEYTLDGEYVGETEIAEGSIAKHPIYYTFYVSANRELWLVYVVNGMVMANPISFNLQSTLPAEVMVSESEALTSYDDVGNQFYVNIPYESTVIVKVVERIDAETLDRLTIEEINDYEQ